MNLLSLFGRKWPILQFAEIKKRARILIIDDQDFTYAELFRKDEYTIEKWDDVDDLEKLESGYFDLILLDIQGVGRRHSNEQGLGILKHIHTKNPAQIVIAFSNSDFSLKYQDFFKLADASLDKAADYFLFKRTVDKLLQERFSINFYVERICALGGKSLHDDPKLRRIAEAAIKGGSTDKLEQYLRKTSDNSEAIGLALKVASVGITLLASLL